MSCLNNEIYSYVNKESIRFHMPGHKGKDILGLGSLLKMDLTEIDTLDNLHSPYGAIEESSMLMARLFGAERSFLLVNGSSAGVIAAILTVCGKGDTVICGRNSHVSLFKGLYLSGARPVYIMPKINNYGFCEGIEPSAIENALAKNKARAVFITSPTYEGVTSDIEKIAAIAHNHGCVLIVDEAHGSHFKFNASFPKTALSQGADIVIQSHHKTLAAMGQAAVLHTQGSLFDIDSLAFNISVMQTTSPSYIIMASLDRNRQLIERDGNLLFQAYVKNLNYLRDTIKKEKNVILFDDNAPNRLDIGKVILVSENNGKELDCYMRREHNIYCEMATDNYALLMTSFADDIDDFDKLLYAISRFTNGNNGGESLYPFLQNLPKMSCTPSQCLSRGNRLVKLSSAVGCTCSQIIAAYPPGIPVIAPGEVFSKEVVQYIMRTPNVTGIIREKNGEAYVKTV